MGYGQFCPVAKAAEVLGEKWTILILRELLYGTSRFNDFQRAISGISPTMLTKRLKELERHGLISKDNHDYRLTDSGRELGPLIRQFAIWGMRWARGEVSDDELDAELLLLDIRRRVRPEFLPETGCTVQVHFDDLARSKNTRAQADWWLVVADGEVALESGVPKGEVDLVVRSDLRTLTLLWLGDITLRSALAQRKLFLKGRPPLIRAIEQWLPLADYANVRPVAATTPASA